MLLPSKYASHRMIRPQDTIITVFNRRTVKKIIIISKTLERPMKYKTL
jgi:hypothetical protein